MPEILRVDGWRVVIYFNDHRPAHVHVLGAGQEAVVALNCPDGPPVLRENYGFKRREASRIGTLLAARLPTLCVEWSKIHGNW